MYASTSRSPLPRSRSSRLRALWPALLVVLALAALAGVLLARGHSFYTLDIQARVDHRDFRVLSPGSPVGHGYGVAGTALMLTNLLYLARRRFARLRLGSMEAWLHMHVLTGLVGSLLVLFHSAFQLRSQVASLTAFSLMLVVVTGLIGRYLYGLAPKADAAALDARLLELDVLGDGLGQRIAAGLRAAPAVTLPARAGLLASLALVPRWRVEARQRRALVRATAAEFLDLPRGSRSERRYMQRLVRETARLASDPVRAAAGSSLLRSWRGLHRFFALLMIVSVSVHIAVAWAFGFRWVLSE